jgi:hypothetical protein
MGIFSRIKKVIGLERQEVFRRWPVSELEEKKLYLENKPAEEFTAEDHYLAAEWVIQRYLPEGEDPTPEQWAKTIGDIRQKIDINLKKAATGELVKTEYVQSEPYVLTKEDFLKDVVPTFSRFGLLPYPYLKDSQGRELWNVLFEFTQPYSYKHGEAKDTLILFCDTYLVEKLVQDLGRTYTALRSAQTEGSAKVKVVCSGKQCPDCMSLDGNKLAVEELLASFKNGAPLFPHPLHIEDEVSWCPAPYLSPEIALREGDDPEFHEALIKIFEK